MKVEKANTATPQKQEPTQQQQLSQNRKSSVWTREKINQLIDLYKKHECLWNHWHESYKNKEKRNRAIEDICTTLSVPKFEFGKKIHNLRNQFNTEMKKLEQRIEEAGVSFDDAIAMDLRCKWSHFDSLMFLRHVIEPRPGGYQASSYQPPKKMRVRFDFSNSEDDLNVSTVLPNNSGSSNTTQPEDVSQFQYDDNVNEEIITDDYQSFENEVIEVDQTNSRGEGYDQKYQPPTQLQKKQELTSISSRNFSQSLNKTKSQHLPANSSTCTSSQTEVININDDSSSVIELSSNNISIVSSHSNTIPATAATTSSSLNTPVISTSSSSNRPVTIVRDQWDAFGELVANEFRNLNSEVSRKRLKRKIMQAMLEVGEEDDHLMDNRSSNN
ncbi:hypothetical protein FF38_00330 [Lucilia cuprina]|uniref:MADF domain-containing protein n=1 Tax=Lucilia cuprina TaxID=7375 RepID=A0A0L0BNX6_LUCCU|nr:hypothetical protein FF38_00330 [Lucilia cuprina]